MQNKGKREVKSRNEVPLELGRVGAAEQKQDYDRTCLSSTMTARVWCSTKIEVAEADWIGCGRRV
jgi:hypothetical protein